MRALLAAAFAALALAAAEPSARAEGAPPAAPRGPGFGRVRYETAIRAAAGEPDVDDYVQSLRAGEVLSAAVAASRGSDLRPSLDVLAPDGRAATVRVAVSGSGRRASVRGFVVPRTGRWTVRVSGVGGTEGDYAIALDVRPLPPTVLHRQHLGWDQPNYRYHAFEGLDGALLDLSLTLRPGSFPVAIRALTDPSGADVRARDGRTAIETAVVTRRGVSLPTLELHDGDGAYRLRTRTAEAEAAYDLRIDVRPQGRPVRRRPLRLDAAEPWLEPREEPLHGRPGFALRLAGRNLSADPLPRVFFGDVEADVVESAADGTSVVAAVPPGTPGTTTSVAVVNPDGQAAVRAGYFLFVQPIRIADLVDAGGGPVREVTAEGGRELRLVGENFEPGLVVSFGSAPASVQAVPSPEEIDLVSPAAQPGRVRIVVTDAYGGTATSDFDVVLKAAPSFAASPYQPSVAPVLTPVTVTVLGDAFEPDDVLAFDGAAVPSVFVDAAHRTFDVPALPAGDHAVTLTDRLGVVKRGPDFTVKAPPRIDAVAAVGGPRVGGTGLAVSGGTVVQVDGADFHPTDSVTLGGVAATLASHTRTRFTFVAPAGTPGATTLSITDGAGQSASLAGALRYVGYSDATSARSPGATAADDLSAVRGAVGDLDRDGRADDVVLVAPAGVSVGTRASRTRLLLGGASGRLSDATSSNLPATGSDASGADDWNATAVALGDLDRANGPDVVIAGQAPPAYYGGYPSVRVFRNSGSGSFTFADADAPPPAYVPPVIAVDETGSYWLVYGAVTEQGAPRALALGDLDRDGDPDLVVGRDRYEFRYVGIDPSAVDFTASPPYVASSQVAYLSFFEYLPATKVYENDLSRGNGFVDRTAAAMPSAGTSTNPPAPAFQATDLALGDVDGDGDLDLVETWSDPTTTTPFGTYRGPGVDTPRVATRVLLNGGRATFTDATSSWIPAGSAPEFWQADRLALADLDKDGDLDLVLVHAAGIDAYAGTPTRSRSALRVLRNDGASRGFADVTATAVPALPGNGDDFRAAALAVRDVEGDGWPDILLATPESLTDATGAALRSARLLRGGPGLAFTDGGAFLPGTGTDTGEAEDLLLGDLAGRADPSLVLVSTVAPARSPGGERLRVLDWNR